MVVLRALKKWKSKHVSLVVAISASGRIATPVLIVEEVNVMASSIKTLAPEKLNQHPEFLRLKRNNWFPTEVVIIKSKNKSMEMQIIKHLIEHMEKSLYRHVPNNARYCLNLD